MSNKEIMNKVKNKTKNIILIVNDTLESDDLLKLVKLLSDREIYIETDGVTFNPMLIGYAKFMVNIQEKQNEKILHNYLLNLYKWSTLAVFKFVIDTYRDFSEAIDLIEKIKPFYPVYFTPKENTRIRLVELSKWLKEYYPKGRVAPRFHIYLYGCTRAH